MSITHINEKRVIETFIELVKIPSPSFGEQVVGRRLIEILQKLSFEVETLEFKDTFNILGRKKGRIDGALPLLLSAHMDTVEPTKANIKYNHNGGIIATLGDTILGADDKSGIAEIIEALTVLNETGEPHGDIEVLFTSAEEKGLQGAKHVNYDMIKSRHALVLDSSGPVGRIVLAAPTHITYRMTVTGRAAHAGIEPEKGTSSITAAAKIISSIIDGRINAETTANVGLIRGGTATNIVPVETIVEGEFRSFNIDTLNKIKDATFDTAKNIARKKQVKLTIQQQQQYPGYYNKQDAPFVCLINGAIERSNITPAYIRSGGGSDANIFNQHGIIAIPLSTGMQKPHTTEEHIYTNDLTKGSLVILEVLRALGSSAFA